jgi:hypothetical protein
MSEPFKLTVPADGRYRVLGPEVAAKYAEMGGAASADAAQFGEAVAEALRDVFRDASQHAHALLKFRTTSHGIEVQLSCGARTSVLQHRLPARKS